ncbi:HypC/HybG/HupF family hydrogenase formation chaperone [Aestuariibacter halophilus]|uniref:HypC/HybG/HupF family hydrogenase formation chaperone n=1 Tax=Fluctibacter halophilus TaxID=226011 RepID=A0ABS8G4R6_9ALTE|nr:HypC/HybG/HupF family hydrogenase formation chaperone [Aestuariibacter halophilus]MCC2615582.1 HypC/HybG/HupF family hydrogenase formation chaperone [Aestuariibacter halophilus]
MCLGVPALITAILDEERGLASAQTDGVVRTVSTAMLAMKDIPQEQLVGRWVLVHVGFAMALIDEQEALRSLTLLSDMEDEDV